MNQYILIISNRGCKFDFPKCGKQGYGGYATETTGFYSYFEQSVQQHYVKWIEINSESTQNETINSNWDLQTGNNFADYVQVTSLVNSADIILSLLEQLPVPGSFVCDVYWFASGDSFDNNTKKLAPLLGVLKKLKQWHLAEVNILPGSNQSQILPLAAKFIGANLVPYNNPDEKYKIKWKNDVIWRGDISASLPCSSIKCNLGGFTLHLAEKEQTLFRHMDCESKRGLGGMWIGDIMKAIEFVDIITVPLMLFSGRNLLLSCSGDQQKLVDLHESVSSNCRTGLLCRMNYIHSSKAFPACSELGTKPWKEAITKSPNDLSPPTLNLYEKGKHVFMILRAQNPNENKNLFFSAYILHDQSHLNSEFFLNAELSPAKTASCGTISTNNLPLIDPRQLLRRNKMFLRVLEAWRLVKGDTMTKGNLENLISAFFIWCEHSLRLDMETCGKGKQMNNQTKLKRLQQVQNISLELSAIANRGNKDLVGNLKQERSDVMKLRPSTSDSLIKSFETSEILKHFDKKGAMKMLSSLQSLGKANPVLPNMSALQDFNTAVALCYHGLTFNIDDQNAEQRDKMCRRMVEKFVKYETMSVSSTSQVPSPITLITSDSPTKPKLPLHTPRKKKRLQKVAEKLYKKRIQKTLAQPAQSSMTLRSTPKKQNPNDPKMLLSSPRVHNMSLRSSTPVKKTTVSKLQFDKEMASNSNRPQQPDKTSVSHKTSQKTHVQGNKKKLYDLVVQTLADNGITKEHQKFHKCSTRLYNVSMAFLKDLKTSKGLASMMQKTVKENVKLVLSFEIQ